MSARELGHELEEIAVVRERILDAIEPAGVENIALVDALGRVLRSDLVAREHIPPFDNSAMDGYAVRAGDLRGAAAGAPVELELAGGVVGAGSVAESPAGAGQCVRVMTGAPIPAGADAVVPHELTESRGDRIAFFAPVAAGKSIRARGGDMRPGDRMLETGVVLSSPRIAILATLGAARVDVTRALRFAVLSPGAELVAVDQTPGPGQIRNSNAHSIAASLRESGVDALDLGIVPDDPASIDAAIDGGLEAGVDGFVSSGGVSAGDFDFVHRVVTRRGKPAWVAKVAMRPGKPLVFGMIEGRPFIGLPGNPASSIVAFEVFARPALRKLRGESALIAETFPVRFPFEHRYPAGRTFLLRTRIEPDRELGGYRVAPPGAQDSSFLAAMAEANALIILPADRSVIAAGELCDAFWLGSSRP